MAHAVDAGREYCPMRAIRLPSDDKGGGQVRARGHKGYRKGASLHPFVQHCGTGSLFSIEQNNSVHRYHLDESSRAAQGYRDVDEAAAAAAARSIWRLDSFRLLCNSRPPSIRSDWLRSFARGEALDSFWASFCDNSSKALRVIESERERVAPVLGRHYSTLAFHES